MTTLQARYSDGKSSKSLKVRVTHTGRSLLVFAEGEGEPIQRANLADCCISPPLGRSNRYIKFPDGSQCETADLAAVMELDVLSGSNKWGRLINYFESRWKTAILCFVLLLAVGGIFMKYGIPQLAKAAAFALPAEALEIMGKGTMKFLDNKFFDPSTLDTRQQQDVAAVFSNLTDQMPQEFAYRLELRKGNSIGANAFALPSGQIIVTDEMVELAQSDEELCAILVHEMAHIHRRHGVRTFFQSAGVFLLFSVLAGDVSTISSTAVSFPAVLVKNGYSRQFEQEADEDVAAFFLSKKMSTKAFQNILSRLDQKMPDIPDSAELISTHPNTSNRIERLQQLELGGHLR